MRFAFVFLVVSQFLAISSARLIRIKTLDDAVNFLRSFGYMANRNASTSVEAMNEPIKRYQRFMGLKETGELDGTTMDMMNVPRCGMSDTKGGIRSRRVGPVGSQGGRGRLGRRFKRYELQGSVWQKTTISWSVIQYSKRPELLGRDREIDRLLGQAFSVWSDSSPLRFHPVTRDRSADITVRFATSNHGDKHPFDGPGLVLAHAFYPEFGGHLHFDDSENWTLTALRPAHEDSTDFLSIAIHEIGHSLGLLHSDDESAVMFPTYRGRQHRLEPDDIDGIRDLYGKSLPSPNSIPDSSRDTQVKPPDEVTQQPLRESTSQPDQAFCTNFKVDAATCMTNGCFLFIRNKVAKIDGRAQMEPGYPKRLDEVFPGLPVTEVVDAAITNSFGYTYLFEKDNVWVYNGAFSEPLLRQIPIGLVLPGLGLTNIDAAVRWNNKAYFFKDGNYWRYDLDKQRPEPNGDQYPKPIAKGWEGLPRNGVDAALHWPVDNRTYFFKDNLYWGLRANGRSVVQHWPRYPRVSSRFWLRCGPHPASNLIPLYLQ